MFFFCVLLATTNELHPPTPTGKILWNTIWNTLAIIIPSGPFHSNTGLLFVLATDKVALLIGNLNYAHHPGLMAPTMDVHELGNLLQQLGFRVVSLIDLTQEDMKAAIDKFLDLLDGGVYGRWNSPLLFVVVCAPPDV